jgi:hypothetical protein
VGGVECFLCGVEPVEHDADEGGLADVKNTQARSSSLGSRKTVSP